MKPHARSSPRSPVDARAGVGSRRGFTLIEILISLALSLFMVLTVYSCFRVATQTVTTCNRLSLENRLLIAGVMFVVDETDSWRTYDNPINPSEQPLRVTPTIAIGAEEWHDKTAGSLAQPFTPFRQSWKTSLCGVPQAPDNPNQAGDYAFSPDWLPCDARTWYRGDGAFASYASNQYLDQYGFGNYALFGKSSNGSSTPTLIEKLTGSSNSMPVSVILPGATEPTTYTWYADQHKGLMYGLGWYGWLDYLPANAMCDFYDGQQAVRAGRPLVLRQQQNGDRLNLGSYGQINNQGDDRVCASRYRANSRGSFLFGTMLGVCHVPLAAPAPLPAPTATDVLACLQMNRTTGGNGPYDWESVAPIDKLMERLHWQDTDRFSHLLPTQPELWPTVTVEVRRLMKYQRTTNLCFIRLADPLGTKAVEIVFPVTGTTLRGARLARGLDQ